MVIRKFRAVYQNLCCQANYIERGSRSIIDKPSSGCDIHNPKEQTIINLLQANTIAFEIIATTF